MQTWCVLSSNPLHCLTAAHSCSSDWKWISYQLGDVQCTAFPYDTEQTNHYATPQEETKFYLQGSSFSISSCISKCFLPQLSNVRSKYYWYVYNARKHKPITIKHVKWRLNTNCLISYKGDLWSGIIQTRSD